MVAAVSADTNGNGSISVKEGEGNDCVTLGVDTTFGGRVFVFDKNNNLLGALSIGENGGEVSVWRKNGKKVTFK